MRILESTSPKGWVGFTVLLVAVIALPTLGLVPLMVRSARVRETSYAATDGTASIHAARPAELVHLSAGTLFSKERPPDGWSHLALKSIPKLTSGDLDTLSAEAFETAGRIRLVIVADVLRSPEDERYSLGRVGVGLSTPASDEHSDVIVTPSDVGGSKEAWSTKERIILAAGSYELSQAELVVATPTFALVRMPTTSLVGDLHKKLSLVYAFLVAPESGRLRTFVWQEDVDQPLQSIVEFKPPALVQSRLNVRAKRLAGIPVAWSFAMTNLPDGIERTISPEFARVILPDRLESSDPRALEAALVEVAHQGPSPSPNS